MIIRDSLNAFYELIYKKYKKVLLVEPYRIKYPPLGLVKLYSFFKSVNIPTAIRYGKHKFEDDDYDVIFITAGEFSYYHKQFIKIIEFYQREYPKAKVVVGGVYVIIDEELRIQLDRMGCDVIACNIKELDDLLFLDYSPWAWNPWNFIFTTRGCKMKCKFCYVKDIEPEAIILPNWKAQIRNTTQDYIMVHDNNIISYGPDHFREVVDCLIQQNKPVMFDNGFDVRFYDKDKLFSKCLRALQDKNLLKYSSIRFAFDSMNQDGKIQRALEDVSEFHPIEDVLVYVLVNFEAEFDECLYRATEVANTGAYPFIQYYTPLDWKDKPEKYRGPKWVPELHALHDFFNKKLYLGRVSPELAFVDYLSEYKFDEKDLHH